MADRKKKLPSPDAWREAKRLIIKQRRYLAIGFGLMLISRLAGFTLPLGIKFFTDEVIRKPHFP